MRFDGISIITDNYEGMVNFYIELLQVEVKDEGDLIYSEGSGVSNI